MFLKVQIVWCEVLGRIGVKLMELSHISQKMSMCFIFGVPSWLYTMLHSVLWRVLQSLKRVCHLYMGRVRAWIKSCWVGSCRERARDVTIMTIGIPGIWNSRNSGIPVSLHILCKWSSRLNPSVSLSYHWGLCVEL